MINDDVLSVWSMGIANTEVTRHVGCQGGEDEWKSKLPASRMDCIPSHHGVELKSPMTREGVFDAATW